MNLKSVLLRAQQAHHQGDFALAEQLYSQLLEHSFQTESVLAVMARMRLQVDDAKGAQHYLTQLCDRFPQNISYCEALANLYSKTENWQQAADCYAQFLQHNPDHPDAYYNFAYNLKLAGNYEWAIENYQLALDNNVTAPEEVHTNMAVIYSEHLRLEPKAKYSLEQALKAAPSYMPAMFNLATLYEEEGDKVRAAQFYQEIIEIEPENYLALARLAHVRRADDSNAPIIKQMRNALTDTSIDEFARTNIHYALGKVLDECGDFDQAFKNYSTANQLDRAANPPYRRAEQERVVDRSINFFTKPWFDKQSFRSDAEPIFICGMFRSGSTLTEQVLASHSALAAGGERDFFVKLATSEISPYPNAMVELSTNKLMALADGYLHDLAKAFPGNTCPTNKRPDNFLYIGLIKTLFPKARIIQTNRAPLDNCLSIYFLHTAASMNYASDLADIAHYYQQYLRLMAHWKGLFPDTIHQLDYDRLVLEPESITRKLLDFLGLPWEPECLDFHMLKNRVKTASIWQVRQPLYQSSSGRWKNYQSHIAELIDEFKE